LTPHKRRSIFRPARGNFTTEVAQDVCNDPDDERQVPLADRSVTLPPKPKKTPEITPNLFAFLSSYHINRHEHAGL
jgi:hypothetical protein